MGVFPKSKSCDVAGGGWVSNDQSAIFDNSCSRNSERI